MYKEPQDSRAPSGSGSIPKETLADKIGNIVLFVCLIAVIRFWDDILLFGLWLGSKVIEFIN